MARPPKYETPEELQAAIDDYFDNGVKKRQIEIGRKDSREVIEVPVPTITGLTLHLGFSDRASFYDYENREGFSHTVKRARTRIENEYEEQLATTGSTGAIFALKNFGWRDKQEIEHGGEIEVKGIDIAFVKPRSG